MRFFDIKDAHTKPDNLYEVIEEYFGNISEEDEYKYIIKEPDHKIINRIEIVVKESQIGLDIDEVSLSMARDKNLLQNVEDSVRSRNEFLEVVTGFSVSERKNKMRRDVVGDIEYATFDSKHN